MLPSGYGKGAGRLDDRKSQRQQGLFKVQLSMGYATRASQQHYAQQHRHSRRSDGHRCNVGGSYRRETKHTGLSAAQRYSAGAGVERRHWVYQVGGSGRAPPSLRCVRAGVCAKVYSTTRGPWTLLLTQVPWDSKQEVLVAHGQRRMWAIKKMDELDALAVTVERLQLESV